MAIVDILPEIVRIYGAHFHTEVGRVVCELSSDYGAGAHTELGVLVSEKTVWAFVKTGIIALVAVGIIGAGLNTRQSHIIGKEALWTILDAGRIGGVKVENG